MEKAAAAAATAGALALLCFERQRLQSELRAENERRTELGLDLMKLRNKNMHSDKSVEVGHAMKPRRGDVFVSTYPKCGTTWMTQIVHMLRTRGDMGFGEITEVIPWDILAWECGQDLDADHVAEPRAFKSHEPWETIPKGEGARYIYVARDPIDAFVSFFHFLPDYDGLIPGDITMEQFKDAIFAGAAQAGQIWHHFLSWWNVRHRPDVLWITFEDLKDDLEGSIRKVAAFLEIECDAELLAVVKEKSSFAFMSAPENKHHFDDHFVRNACKPGMGLAEDSEVKVGKVRAGGGRAGRGRAAIPASVLSVLESKWAEVIAPATGCADYAALRAKGNEVPE